MIHAIQKAYYLAAQNPSDNSTLVNLAKEINLDEQLFAETLNSNATKEVLLKQMAFSQKIGAMGFPSLILEQDGQYDLLQYDYNDPSVVLNNKLIVSNREQR